MKRNHHNYYVKQFIRTLKEFDEYNKETITMFYDFITNKCGLEYPPHMLCVNALGYSFVSLSKHIEMKRFFLNNIMEQYVYDIKKYLEYYKKQNKAITDEQISQNIRKFTLFSFLNENFGSKDMSIEDIKMFFYNG